MKIIFIALVVALTSSSLLVQEQAGSVVPESQKRDITVPTAGGDSLRISYGGNVNSVTVDGNQLAAKQDTLANRHLQDDSDNNSSSGDGETLDVPADQLADSNEVFDVSEVEVVSDQLNDAAAEIINDDKASLTQQINAALILLTPSESDGENDPITLDQDQAKAIRDILAALSDFVPKETLAEPTSELTAPDESTDDQQDQESGNDDTKKLAQRRRAKALRRIKALRRVKRQRHRVMRSYNFINKGHKVATAFKKRRSLHLAPPHFVRYNTPVSQNRNLVGNPVPKTEAQVSTSAENKEVV